MPVLLWELPVQDYLVLLGYKRQEPQLNEISIVTPIYLHYLLSLSLNSNKRIHFNTSCFDSNDNLRYEIKTS